MSDEGKGWRALFRKRAESSAIPETSPDTTDELAGLVDELVASTHTERGYEGTDPDTPPENGISATEPTVRKKTITAHPLPLEEVVIDTASPKAQSEPHRR